MAVPPFIKCVGVRTPAAKALNGVYEYTGAVDGRPCYRQCGISSGNQLWFTDGDEHEAPMWVVTPQGMVVGGESPGTVIARSLNLSRWPWEVEGWSVCSRNQTFATAPKMTFVLLNPAADVEVTMPGGCFRYLSAGIVNGRCSFRSADNHCLRLFFMPGMSRWVLAEVDPNGAGIQRLALRSARDDGSSWASLWPWEVHTHGWEAPTMATHGVNDGDAQWLVQGTAKVSLASPGVLVSPGSEDGVRSSLGGFYEPHGMANGRCFYLQQLKDAPLDADGDTAGPKCLWFAEDRGQWVLTTPDRLGDSRTVLARIFSRAWWPWEAHLGGSTSPGILGAVPFATMPAWHGGSTVLSSTRAAWEVADASSSFQKSRGMVIDLDPDARCAVVKAADESSHPFLGVFERSGLLSARPLFLQMRDAKESKGKTWKPPAEPRYVLWYAEELEQWVITEDFRLLDVLTVDARVSDSCWFPWDISADWEVADGSGSFVIDALLTVDEL